MAILPSRATNILPLLTTISLGKLLTYLKQTPNFILLLGFGFITTFLNKNYADPKKQIRLYIDQERTMNGIWQ